jgi:outer membrane cobalamin receptor
MKRFVLLATAWCAALLFFAGPARAAGPATGTVVGSAKDPSGNPIAGAGIAIVSPERRYGTVSDQAGAFRIDDVDEGVYELIASAKGYQPVSRREFGVQANATVTLSVTFVPAAPSSIATIGTVLVNGRQALSRASAPTTALDPQNLADQGVEQLSDQLGQQIAVTLTRQLGGAPGLPQSASVRGPDPTETLIEIDGHVVNNNNTGDADLELIDPSIYSDVQIVYGVGPSDLVSANTEGGIINFRTIDPTSKDEALIRFSAGSFGTFAETLQTTGTDQRFGYALSFHRFTTQGEVNAFPITNDSTFATDVIGSSILSTTTLAKLRYSLGIGDGYVQLTYRDTAAYRDLSGPLSTPDDVGNTGPGALFSSFPGAAVRSNSPAYDVDVSVPVGARGAIGIAPANITVRHMTSLADQSVENIDPALNPYLLNSADKLEDNSVQYERTLQNGTLSFAADVRNEILTAPDALAPATTEGETQRSFVGRYEWSANRYLHFTAAAYYNRFDTFGTLITPRAAVVWTPNGDTVVRASVGTGFNAPVLTELAFNPDLTAERVTAYELGLERRVGAGPLGGRGTINLYRTNLRDTIFFTVDPTTGALLTLENLGDVVYTGAEFRYEQPLAHQLLLLATYGINVAYQQGGSLAFNPTAPNVVPDQQFQGIAPHKGQLVLERSARQGIDFDVSGSYESLNNDLNRPAYVRVDAGVWTRLHKTDFALTARNLTDIFDDRFTLPKAGPPYPTPLGNVTTDAFSLQGRSVTLTVTQHV